MEDAEILHQYLINRAMLWGQQTGCFFWGGLLVPKVSGCSLTSVHFTGTK